MGYSLGIMQQTARQPRSPQELQKLRNNRTGLMIFQLSWILVFVCLIIVNLQVRANFVSWPPPGVERLGALLPIGATVALLVSAVLAHRAFGAVKAGSMSGFFPLWRVTLALGLVFVLAMAVEWVRVPVSGQYSSLFRVMTGFHAAHALVIGVFLWRTYRFAQAGMYDADNHWGVEAAVKLWDFVVIAWLMFFAVLYVV